MGIDTNQLRHLIVGPTLNHLGLWSQSAENLVLGTALTESRGEYIHQLGRGPALGLWQMEPFTHDDIWANFLKYKSDLTLRMHALETPAKLTEGANELVGNLYYGAAMCRLQYRRAPEALPAAGDALGMAQLWKKRYNTAHGAGSVEHALPYFVEACQ